MTLITDETFVVDADIGSTVQAYDADLASWAGVTRAAGFDTFVATPSQANFMSLIAYATFVVDADIGVTVQAYDADLATLATAFTTASASGAASLAFAEDTDNGVLTVSIQGPADVVTSSKIQTLQDITGTIYVSSGTDVAVADGGTGARNAADARTNLGLVIGTNVQAYEPTATDFIGPILQIKGSNPDVIFLHGLVSDTAMVFNQMRQQGVHQIILTYGAVYNPKFLEQVGAAAGYVIFTSIVQELA